MDKLKIELKLKEIKLTGRKYWFCPLIDKNCELTCYCYKDRRYGVLEEPEGYPRSNIWKQFDSFTALEAHVLNDRHQEKIVDFQIWFEYCELFDGIINLCRNE